MHFESFMFDSGFDGALGAAMIDGAQRVQAGVGLGHQAGTSTLPGGVEQLSEELGREPRHIAGDQKIPVRMGSFQGSEQASDRSTVLDQIRRHGQTQMRVSLRSSDQSHISSRGANPFGGPLDQHRALDRQQRLVASHARAAAPGEDESRAGIHEKMVAMRRRENRAAFLSNKKVYICCLAIAMLAASPMRAADASASSSLLTPRADSGKLSVVRVDRRTGKLVRTISGGDSSPKLTPVAPPPAHIQELVEKSARAHNIDPLLVESVIQVESNYNHFAVSPKGAEGLMQLMPGTARMLGVSNSFDPAENIEAGVKYLRYLQSLYQDDRLALAAYNAGPKAVEKYKGTPPFPETQDYVNQVGQRYQMAKRDEAVKNAAQPAAPAPPEEVQAPAEEQRPQVERIIDLNARPVPRIAQE